MFNTIYMKKESVNYKCKHTFKSWIIFIKEWMGLLGTEEIHPQEPQNGPYRPFWKALI